MRKNRYCFHEFLVLVLCSLFTVAASHLAEGIVVSKKSHQKNGLLDNGSRVAVFVDVADFPNAGFPYSNSNWWGAEFSAPKSFIKSFTVKVNDKKCWVQFSAYADLVNITDVDLNMLQEGFQIHITGGQTAMHYEAALYYDIEGFLTKRRVWSPLFPNEVWEETQYSFIRREQM